MPAVTNAIAITVFATVCLKSRRCRARTDPSSIMELPIPVLRVQKYERSDAHQETGPRCIGLYERKESER